MFCLNDTMRYYLCPGRTDMRKGISSLCGVVHEKMRSDVRNGDVFIFIGQSRKLMKLLHAEDGGMVMYVKRLEAYSIKYSLFSDIFCTFALYLKGTRNDSGRDAFTDGNDAAAPAAGECIPG